MAGPGSETWCSAALEAAESLGLPLELSIVGGAQLADLGGRFPEAYGLSPGGAVIIRPDGIVAWRAVDATGVSAQATRDVLATLVSRHDPVAPMRVESTDGDGT